MIVPFLDLKPIYFEIKEELDAAYRRVMDSGWFILGRELAAFEEEFASYCGVKHCIGVGNGLDALHLILRALEIGSGDEVIVPANTYIATWLAVSYCGASPIPVEPDHQTFNIKPEFIEKAITADTKAILAVHLYGQPADMDAVNTVAAKYNLMVVEDAAQAHGAKYKGKKPEDWLTQPDSAFIPAKNLGAFGDGGAAVTNDDEVANKIRMLRNYGSKVKYHHEEIGFNSRLDELQAAFLRVKLTKLDEWNKRRRDIAVRYLDNLSQIPDLSLPFAPQWCEPAWHIFAIQHPQRDTLQKYLLDSGIETLIHYPIPPHKTEAYAKKQNWPQLPVAEKLAQHLLSLPIGPLPSADFPTIVTNSIKYFK